MGHDGSGSAPTTEYAGERMTPADVAANASVIPFDRVGAHKCTLPPDGQQDYQKAFR